MFDFNISAVGGLKNISFATPLNRLFNFDKSADCVTGRAGQ
jgi:hypothetical protein